MTTDKLRERLEALLADATPGPWELCHHLKGVAEDAACRCGYRGVVYGPKYAGYAVFQPGHDPAPGGQEGSEPPRYKRPIEIANAQLIVGTINALPTLLAALASQQARIAEMEGQRTDAVMRLGNFDGALIRIREITARAEAAEDRVKALVEGVRWYGEQAAGCRKLSSAGDPFRRALDADGGKRARALVAGQDAGEGTLCAKMERGDG